MTKAEKLTAPIGIALYSKPDENGEAQADYIAEFKPGYTNPLHIRDANYDEKEDCNIIFLTHESGIELAKFLKELFLDEVTS